MNVELHTNPAIFSGLAAEWDSLLPSSNSVNFFMRSDWQRVWWTHLYRGELLILTIRDDAGKLQGIAPFFVERDHHGKATISIIGHIDVTDYIDLIYAPGREQEVMRTIWDFLCSPNAPEWDILHFSNIPQNSPTLTLLPQIAQQQGNQVEIAVEDTCPVIDLSATYEAYLETLDKKQRHEIRRKRRRAEDFEIHYYTVGPQHHIDEEIDAFLELMAMSTPDKAVFLRERGHREFFNDMGATMFAKGLLDLSFLTVNGQRAAAMWNFAYGDRMMLYNSGLNPVDYSALSPGIVLLALNIEDAIRRGFKKYDFLQGDEEYKFRMGARPTTVHLLTIQR